MSQVLFICPFCHRPNFTATGLRHHRCQELGGKQLHAQLVAAEIQAQTREAKRQGELFAIEGKDGR